MKNVLRRIKKKDNKTQNKKKANNTIKNNQIKNNIIEEQEKNEINKMLKAKYNYKINYIFKKTPNFKYKSDIVNWNEYYGINDIFEVYTTYKQNKLYLCSAFNRLRIYELDPFQLILVLYGHDYERIASVRYFINKNNNNEYLISSDKSGLVVIYDITNNYKIKYRINAGFGANIYSCLLVFPELNKYKDNYIVAITDTYDSASLAKFYSFNSGELIREMNTGSVNGDYLLSWYNKKLDKYYVIMMLRYKIIITNLIEDELYADLKQEREKGHYSGFIYSNDNSEYVCSTSVEGYITVWDLYSKNIIKIIYLNGAYLHHIIQWNEKYIIVAADKSIKIINFENNKVVSELKGHDMDGIICIKKIFHPIYGESLLSACHSQKIKLWITA